MKSIIIAIDGPAGAGKSTTARRVALALNYIYIDTGAMYRAVTLAAIRNAATQPEQIERLLPEMHIELKMSPQGQRTFLNNEDVSQQIRLPEISSFVSFVSSLKPVRTALVAAQRRMGIQGGVVMDGRDIGTVVFPDAQLKIYMIASLQERARRRLLELQKADPALQISEEEIMEQIAARDAFDTMRENDPLRPAEDAVFLDTSGLSIEQQTEFILQAARSRML